MQDIDRKSLGLGVLVYVMWGFFPLYFVLLGPAGSLEVIVHRALWGLLACIFLIIAFSRWAILRELLGNRDIVLRLATSATLDLLPSAKP